MSSAAFTEPVCHHQPLAVSFKNKSRVSSHLRWAVLIWPRLTFDLSRYQLHKTISTTTKAEGVRKDAAEGEEGFSRLSKASGGLQQPVKSFPFSCEHG